MIYAALEDAPRYRGILPRLDRALSLLTPAFLASAGTQRQSLEGEALYVTRFDIETSADEVRLFEYHRRYLDLFVCAAGEERVDLAAPSALTLREQNGDYWGGTGSPEQSLILTPGRFLVLFPGDAHRPGMAVDTPQKVSRIVFKILIEE